MAADPLDALRLPVVPVDPRPEFTAALLRRITSAAAEAQTRINEAVTGTPEEVGNIGLAIQRALDNAEQVQQAQMRVRAAAIDELIASGALERHVRSQPAPQPPQGLPIAARVRDNPTVRYFVGDLDAAIEFYCQRLGFEEELRSAPAFAMLYGGGFRLLLSVPGLPGAGRTLPDGTVPAAGGSNRITVQVTDVTAAVAELRAAGVRIRADVSAGVAVRQALIEDPAGNLVELYEPTAGYHERPSTP
jgi:catechol 2,3-dioxygenase-like lactoylglutathione lyase family enzyme